MSEEERAVTIEMVSNFLAAAEGARFIDQKMISSRNALQAIVNDTCAWTPNGWDIWISKLG